MKLTKKAAALLLAASLAVSVCATPVFADDPATTPTTPSMGSQKRDNTNAPGGSGTVTGSTNVYYKVTESYAWSVPATIDFGENAGANNTSTVNATLNEDGPGKKADADNQWKGTAPKVVVSKNVIGVGKRLQITFNTDYLDKDGKFYVLASEVLASETTKPGDAQAETQKLYFKIQKNDTDKTELTKTKNEVLSVPAGTNTAYQELVFTLTTAEGNNAAEKAGSYTGAVVFKSEIV